jgi:hypothetical protein
MTRRPVSASTQNRPRPCKIHGDKAEGAAFDFRVRDPLLGKERHAERCPARDGDVKRRRTFWREERSQQSCIKSKSRTKLNLRDAGAVDFRVTGLPANQASGQGRTQTGGQMGIWVLHEWWLFLVAANPRPEVPLQKLSSKPRNASRF